MDVSLGEIRPDASSCFLFFCHGRRQANLNHKNKADESEDGDREGGWDGKAFTHVLVRLPFCHFLSLSVSLLPSFSWTNSVSSIERFWMQRSSLLLVVRHYFSCFLSLQVPPEVEGVLCLSSFSSRLRVINKERLHVEIQVPILFSISRDLYGKKSSPAHLNN
mmetsp:Transcript_13424/g.26549  ORF Transcript_13424/g.26549 Transcript_13424/m.26549 type:complete len:163 (-) Transcript_13424:2106-2594(-)